MLKCEYYDKAYKQKHCAFDCVCAEENCIFVAKKYIEQLEEGKVYEIEELKEEISCLKDDIDNKDAEISNLEDDVCNLESKILDLEEERKHLLDLIKSGCDIHINMER